MPKQVGLGTVAIALAALVLATAGITSLSNSSPAPVLAAIAAPHSIDRFLLDKRITDSRGLARSTRGRNVLFTHNGSGDHPRVFAVDAAGRTKAVLRLEGVSTVAWEDISTGPSHSLWVGDIGDQARTRGEISVYRFTEPRRLTTRGIRPLQYDLRYPNRPHHAKALLVHPVTARVFIVTTSRRGGAIYRAPKKLSTGAPNKLTRIAAAPSGVTAATFSPDAKTVILANRKYAHIYSGIGGAALTVPNPAGDRSESLELSRASSHLLMGSKGSSSAVYRAPLPTLTAPRPTSPSTEATPVDLPGWKLELAEDFDFLSAARWNVRDQTYLNHEESYLLARNVTVANGVLRIQSKNEYWGGRSYTSGYIDTNGKISVPDYFRAEVRAKVPFERGMWAAPLWFRPADGSGGEIDLIETYGVDKSKPMAKHTIHTDYGSSHRQANADYPFASLGDPVGTSWHDYVIEKLPGEISMWVDGVKTAAWKSGSPSWFNTYFEAGKRWNLRVNLQIGCGTPCDNHPDPTTDWFPDKSAMQIDHIYVWTRTHG